MTPYFLEVPTSADVVISTTKFCNKHNTGLCVLFSSSSVANVTLRGRFDLSSLSATVLPPIRSNGWLWRGDGRCGGGDGWRWRWGGGGGGGEVAVEVVGLWCILVLGFHIS
ncbi:hypothetical protein RHGRI_017078 [Rhododendron griersonianum]|uniref:Uncharacterized protein n=1 Tax=Rhododendron griersonianum TaxID=479676 RepID=A0AAV6JWK7_9ERIC|nr:hypothetical protein RHGRI_017078 [Rhododendron griersonianum]